HVPGLNAKRPVGQLVTGVLGKHARAKEGVDSVRKIEHRYGPVEVDIAEQSQSSEALHRVLWVGLYDSHPGVFGYDSGASGLRIDWSHQNIGVTENRRGNMNLRSLHRHVVDHTDFT